MPLPTFVIVGAQKCGTSSLHRMLRQHPQVHMSRTKELHYFDRHFDRGLEWYTQQFTPRRQHKEIGETTPAYMYRAPARRRLIQQLPDARIVMILRNPVDRAYSHFWHDTRRLEQARRTRPVPVTFEAALAGERPELFASLVADSEPGRAQGASSDRRDSYIGRGEYIDQIEPFLDAYGEDRVLILLLEDLIADRPGCLRDLFRFLRVSADPATTIEEVHVNRYRRPDEAGRARAATYEAMQPATRATLVEHYRPFNERLAKLLGRDLSHWQ